MRKIFNFILIFMFLINSQAAHAQTSNSNIEAHCAESHTARVLFIGDIMAHVQQLNAAKTKNNTYDFSPQFRRVKPLFDNAFLIGNLETVFAGTNKKLNYSGYPLFNTPDSLTDALKNSLGIDFLTLANNHIFDRGERGARRTAEVLERENIPWTGLSLKLEDKEIPENNAVLIEDQGLKWAFVNFTYGSNMPVRREDDLTPEMKNVKLNIISEKNIKAGMQNAKALSPDVIIACFHWGNEYHFKPNVHQKNAADLALKFGADAVIGTHPHVLQPVEIVKLKNAEMSKNAGQENVKIIAWSLGNFVSFQRTLPRERTCILALEFEKNDNSKTRLIRVSAAPLYVIAPGRGRTEVTYAGDDENTIKKLDFSGLSREKIKQVRAIGKSVLEFLGAVKNNKNEYECDEYGFYTLWNVKNPDVMPVPRKKSP